MTVEHLIVGATGFSSQEELRRSFYYNKGDLFFYPFQGTRNRWSRLSNRKLGHKNKDGYIVCMWKNKTMYLHRMIFMYHRGYLPEQIDHIDGNKSNNKIDNLRAADNSLNMHNTTKRTDNTSGVKGVWFSNRYNKWIAEFQFRNKKIHVGTFIDKKEAEIMIQQARQAVVGEFTNHG